MNNNKTADLILNSLIDKSSSELELQLESFDDLSRSEDKTVIVSHSKKVNFEKSALIPDYIELSNEKMDATSILIQTLNAEDEPLGEKLQEAPIFSPLPDQAEEKVDLGEDLLEDESNHLISPVLQETQKKIYAWSAKATEPQEIVKLLEIAENHFLEKKYYLSRKLLRLALTKGAHEKLIKELLREIRIAEFPNSAYATLLENKEQSENSSTIMEKLVNEFYPKNPGFEKTEKLNLDIKSLLQSTDRETLFDLGVGLLEISQYDAAENIFISIAEENADDAYDAYYLAAIVKESRNDFAGALSILRKLSDDKSRSEIEKLPTYYFLAELFEKTEQLNRSKEFFLKVASIDPNFRNVKEKISGY